MKTIAYSSPFVPAEWIAAHGVRPMRLRPDLAAAARLAGPLTGVCPYARAFVGQALASPGVDAVVLATTCDQMRRAAEWPGPAAGPPVFLMNVPATWQTPASVRLYRDELERLGRSLVRLGGLAPTRERLAEVMEDYDVRRAALRGLLGTLDARDASEALARFDRGEAGIGWHGHALLRGHERSADVEHGHATARDHATRRPAGEEHGHATARDHATRRSAGARRRGRRRPPAPGPWP